MIGSDFRELTQISSLSIGNHIEDTIWVESEGILASSLIEDRVFLPPTNDADFNLNCL